MHWTIAGTKANYAKVPASHLLVSHCTWDAPVEAELMLGEGPFSYNSGVSASMRVAMSEVAVAAASAASAPPTSAMSGGSAQSGMSSTTASLPLVREPVASASSKLTLTGVEKQRWLDSRKYYHDEDCPASKTRGASYKKGGKGSRTCKAGCRRAKAVAAHFMS